MGIDPIEEAVVIQEPGVELDVRPDTSLFRTDDPAEFLTKATGMSNKLAEVIRAQQLFVDIQGRAYVRVEGWTMLGSLLGVFPVTVWTRKLEDGWEARVEAKTLAGQVVGSAESECLRSERTWANRDDYALRSMAQTRATSKALRMPLGFVMTLAGFEATPFEEMPPADQLEDSPPKDERKGGLTKAQKRLYAAFKNHEEAGRISKEGFEALLTMASCEDLAHASDEQCQSILEWMDKEVPFDTGPQSPGTDGEAPVAGAAPSEAGASTIRGGSDSGPGVGRPAADLTREEALELRRENLTAQLLELANKLGRYDEVAERVRINAAADQKPAAHLSWLEHQVQLATEAVNRKETP